MDNGHSFRIDDYRGKTLPERIKTLSGRDLENKAFEVAENQPELAIRLYYESLARGLDPTDAERVYFNLGTIFTDRRDLEVAKQFYRLSIIQGGEHAAHAAHSWFNLSIIFSYEGRIHEAMEAMRESIKINPDDRDAHDYLNRLEELERSGFERGLLREHLR